MKKILTLIAVISTGLMLGGCVGDGVIVTGGGPDVAVVGNPYYTYGGISYYSSGGRYFYYRNHHRYYTRTLPRGGRYYNRDHRSGRHYNRNDYRGHNGYRGHDSRSRVRVNTNRHTTIVKPSSHGRSHGNSRKHNDRDRH